MSFNEDSPDPSSDHESQPPNHVPDLPSRPASAPAARRAKAKSIVRVDAHGDNYMCATISPKDDFTPSQETALKEWHGHQGPFAFLVSEPRPGDGIIHYHSVFQSLAKTTSKTREKLERLLKNIHVPYERMITVKVKKCTDLIGWFHYLTKDATSKRLYIKGWEMSWIKQQCLDNVKKIPFKVLLKGKRFVTKKGATALIIAYSAAKAYPITGKHSFMQVVCMMAQEGYEFQSVNMRYCFSQALAVNGNTRAMMSLLESELQFLED